MTENALNPKKPQTEAQKRAKAKYSAANKTDGLMAIITQRLPKKLKHNMTQNESLELSIPGSIASGKKNLRIRVDTYGECR
jgi:hypothetical protein